MAGCKPVKTIRWLQRPRGYWLIAGVALASCMGLVANSGIRAFEPQRWTAQQRATILEECAGRIDEFVVQIPAGELDVLLPTWRSLLPQLQPQTGAYFILGSAQECARLRRAFDVWPLERPDRFHTVNWGDFSPRTHWARDRFTALRAPDDSALLLQPALPQRLVGGEDVLPALMQQRLDGFSLQSAEIYLEGGDLLAGARWLLVGSATIRAAQVVFPIDEAPLRSLLQDYFGKPVIFVPGYDEVTAWPGDLDFHLDMILTVLHDDSVLLGDPDWADRLVNQSLDGSARRSLGDPTRSATSLSHAAAMRQRLATVHRALRKAGLEVKRIPLYLVPEQVYALSYNNVIQEQTPQGPAVYLPQYGSPELDAAAEAVYVKLGYRVCPVDVRGVVGQQGALRCLVNVVRRSQPH